MMRINSPTRTFTCMASPQCVCIVKKKKKIAERTKDGTHHAFADKPAKRLDLVDKNTETSAGIEPVSLAR